MQAAAAESTYAVASPCNRVCRIDPGSGWCLGCWRTLDEIAAWSGLSAAAQVQVVESLEARRASLQAGDEGRGGVVAPTAVAARPRPASPAPPR
ncbi:MAG: DUF1289 domain-containing protein [Pseudomonadota bacterium]|nr:DUF1289 domain-containing protein [Pseudomonadota bacterium]